MSSAVPASKDLDVTIMGMGLRVGPFILMAGFVFARRTQPFHVSYIRRALRLPMQRHLNHEASSMNEVVNPVLDKWLQSALNGRQKRVLNVVAGEALTGKSTTTLQHVARRNRKGIYLDLMAVRLPDDVRKIAVNALIAQSSGLWSRMLTPLKLDLRTTLPLAVRPYFLMPAFLHPYAAALTAAASTTRSRLVDRLSSGGSSRGAQHQQRQQQDPQQQERPLIVVDSTENLFRTYEEKDASWVLWVLVEASRYAEVVLLCNEEAVLRHLFTDQSLVPFLNTIFCPEPPLSHVAQVYEDRLTRIDADANGGCGVVAAAAAAAAAEGGGGVVAGGGKSAFGAGFGQGEERETKRLKRDPAEVANVLSHRMAELFRRAPHLGNSMLRRMMMNKGSSGSGSSRSSGSNSGSRGEANDGAKNDKKRGHRGNPHDHLDQSASEAAKVVLHEGAAAVAERLNLGSPHLFRSVESAAELLRVVECALLFALEPLGVRASAVLDCDPCALSLMQAGLLRLETSSNGDGGRRRLRVAQDASIVFALAQASNPAAHDSVRALLDTLESHLARSESRAEEDVGVGSNRGGDDDDDDDDDDEGDMEEGGRERRRYLRNRRSRRRSGGGGREAGSGGGGGGGEGDFTRLAALSASVRSLLSRVDAAYPVLDLWIDAHMNGQGPESAESWREVEAAQRHQPPSVLSVLSA